MNTVNYEFLGKAQELYSRAGYQPIEVPWRVSAGILEITKPPLTKDYLIGDSGKGLLASGEQGFLSLMNKGILPPGRYQTVTPCFRNEPYDVTHSKQFMKLELIEILSPDKNDGVYLQSCINYMMGLAAGVYEELAPDLKSKFVCTTQRVDDPLRSPGTSQWDIEIKVKNHMIELGSYGARRAHFGSWIYGTGLAEPRFSKTLAALRS